MWRLKVHDSRDLSNRNELVLNNIIDPIGSGLSHHSVRHEHLVMSAVQ